MHLGSRVVLRAGRAVAQTLPDAAGCTVLGEEQGLPAGIERLVEVAVEQVGLC